MSLYLKHRPTTFDEVFGNEDTVAALKNMAANPEECPHSFLFHGPTGCGKTTVARILGRELGATNQDFREMDSADFRGIDAVRDIRQQAHYQPLEGPRRMWLLDECHQLTNAAQSALLKMLEDTPSHVYFALCTTDPQKLLKTIRGRCQQFQMKTLSDKDMRKLLIHTCKKEKVKPDKKVLVQIIKDSQGHPRNALQILDKVLQVPGEQRLQAAKQAAKEESESIELCRALLKGEPWSKIRQILKGLKDEDAEGIRRHVLGYANAVLLNGNRQQAAIIIGEFQDPFYDTGFPGLTYACYVVSQS